MHMLACVLSVMFLAPLRIHQQPTPPPPPPPQIDLQVQTPPPSPPGGATTDPGSMVQVPADWLKKQADALQAVVGCYLDKPSLDNLAKVETDQQMDASKLIEFRIKLLAKLTKENTASHCQ